MNQSEPKFELPKNIEKYLATLSKLYDSEGSRQLQEIIVNSQIRVHAGWSYDNWDGGTHGHALYLDVPEAIFLKIVKNKDNFQQKIKEDLNKVHNIQNEFIVEVFIEIEEIKDLNWRQESGLLLRGKRLISPKISSRIWGSGEYRIFLSHKAEVKKDVALLKENLKLYGISCFVAHEDIDPTREWQDEIENALFSMDAFIALMTDEFHDSFWTDQEIGVAFGRDVPIICVKLGTNPYGFIGKFQALSCSWNDAPKEIVKILIKHDRMLNVYIKAVHESNSYEQGNTLSLILPLIEKLSDTQVEKLISAYNENFQVRDCFGFNGKKPSVFGKGLLFHLKRLTNKKYSVSNSGQIKVQ